MAARGPFTIEGHEWRTDAAGNITRTQPEQVIAEVVRTPAKKDAERVRSRMVRNRDALNDQIADMTVERDQLNTDIANLDDIIANSR